MSFWDCVFACFDSNSKHQLQRVSEEKSCSLGFGDKQWGTRKSSIGHRWQFDS